MGLILAIIVGGIIGWLASLVSGRNEGLIGSVIIGIIGAFIGGALSSFFGSGTQNFMSFTWTGMFWTFLGSLILVVILNAVQSRGRHHSQL